jgi:hypothetical protein
MKHKGSPPNDASSAPESGTVRDETEIPEQQQYKRPAKGKSNSPDQSGGQRKSGAKSTGQQ